MKLLPLVLVAPFWVGAYIVGGWRAVAIMALIGVAGEILILLGELCTARQHRAVGIARLGGSR